MFAFHGLLDFLIRIAMLVEHVTSEVIELGFVERRW